LCAQVRAFLALLFPIDCYELKTRSTSQTFRDLDWIAHTAIKRTIGAGSFRRDRESELTGFADSTIGTVITVFRARDASISFFLFYVIVKKEPNPTRSALINGFS
jgi:hypothetical protein